jgi:hypothetical protein
MGLNVGLKQKAGMTRLAKLLNLKMSRAGYAHRRVGACWVFAAPAFLFTASPTSRQTTSYTSRRTIAAARVTASPAALSRWGKSGCANQR